MAIEVPGSLNATRQISESVNQTNIEIDNLKNQLEKELHSYITADRIEPGSIDASKIEKGTITVASGVIKSIDASTITAGTLSADYVKGGTISGTSINIGNGAFKVDSDGNMTANNGYLNGEIHSTTGTIGGFTISNNSLSETVADGSYTSTLLLTAAGLQFDTTRSDDNSSSTYINSDGIYTDRITSMDRGIVMTVNSGYNIRLCTKSGNLISWRLMADSSGASINGSLTTYGMTCNGDASISGMITSNILHGTDNHDTVGYNSSSGNTFLGSSGRSGNTNIYAGGTVAVQAPGTYSSTWAKASDRNLKHDIKDLDNKYVDMFDKLKPASFIYNGGTKTHTGFIAQEMEQAITDSGMTVDDFAGLVTPKDNDEHYYIDYVELIAVLTAKIKQLEAKIDRLEASNGQ
jgi:hypothetical protein